MNNENEEHNRGQTDHDNSGAGYGSGSYAEGARNAKSYQDGEKAGREGKPTSSSYSSDSKTQKIYESAYQEGAKKNKSTYSSFGNNDDSDDKAFFEKIDLKFKVIAFLVSSILLYKYFWIPHNDTHPFWLFIGTSLAMILVYPIVCSIITFFIWIFNSISRSLK
jgi:hypothetical protein